MGDYGEMQDDEKNMVKILTQEDSIPAVSEQGLAAAAGRSNYGVLSNRRNGRQTRSAK